MTGSIQTALGTLGKTIELVGFEKPLHQTGTNIYHTAIAMQMETYQCTNLLKETSCYPNTSLKSH